MDNQSAKPTSAGIEALIARLRQEGVDEGQAEAERVLAEAESRARTVLTEAETEAKSRLEAAEAEVERLKRAGREALEIAMRDAVLELKQQLSRGFAEQVGGTVSDLMRDDEMLKRMVLAIAARSRSDAGLDQAKDIDVILPRAVVGLDDLRRKPEELREGSLTHFAATAAADMLRKGITFSRAEDEAGGIRVTLSDEGVVVDLTDKAVADVILRHLQPRFRALLENVVS